MTLEQTNNFNTDCSCQTINEDKLKQIEKKLEDSCGISELKFQKYFATSPTSLAKSSIELIKTFLASYSRMLAKKSIVNIFLKDLEPRFKNLLPFEISGGLFLGFDFHETEEGPKLIEINTNAGGLLINSILYEVQDNCCNLHYTNHEIPSFTELGEQTISFVLNEWAFQNINKELKTIIVLDDDPEKQFLYPEFEVFQHIMRQKGKQCFICSPTDLRLVNGVLYYLDYEVDFIYNRHTDFLLRTEEMQSVAEAFASKQICLTPNPIDYLLYANKQNLQYLSDRSFLEQHQIEENDIHIIQKVIPDTKIVHAADRDALWENRKSVFFKPQNSYGSKGVYSGKKLTKSKFDEILKLDYITQKEIPPSKRTINHIDYKIDYRVYVYHFSMILLTSRLYQGQTTNFRTEGGGFSAVLES
ncbi:circularly permuted ATPgrasp domain protein [Leptospira ognonensis]|uniref:Circularly permuted ATPgrasp domain protein n=1 Tax=Leptospira ognonensis TaxID=2484945 RepID=A0A4R9K4V0_9LEPT|nr:circularly permuted ATPgrasp domain protein [Leptospira ognonensis]TGL59287.1 circularly permuted ATPgrasp domain protein [Leptospira ognonensis]